MKHNRHAIDRSRMNRLLCLGELLLGILLLIHPVGFTAAVLRVVGALLAALGTIRLVGYFRAEATDAARGGGLAAGLCLLLAGMFCFFRWEWFVLTFPILTSVYGVLTLANGLNKLQWAVDALRLGQPRWYWPMGGALLTLLFGGLIVANPFATTAVLWTFLAMSLLAEAVLDILSFWLAGN